MKSNGTEKLRVVGLFAGIGGIEVGLHAAGHETVLLCEIEPGAQRVLRAHFPGVPLESDVCALRELPPADVVAGGFPCQDLSQAGKTEGIQGKRSGLVGEVFRLLSAARPGPRWVLLENVPFMLALQRGKAMSFLTRTLSEMGWTWAYRVVDARSFGLPQRRQRVIFLASRTEDPRTVIFQGDAGPAEAKMAEGLACGFYWTEGIRGLGWAVDAVPTLKGGSTVGIPSPPAIWLPKGGIVTPDVRDAERLQGFEEDWTLPALEGAARRRLGIRWKLVGNAVSVPLFAWVGRCLAEPRPWAGGDGRELPEGAPWPDAAWGRGGKAWAVPLSAWPAREPYQHLAGFLDHPTQPLSERATAGFLSRARQSTLRFVPGFLDAVTAHLEHVRAQQRLPLERRGPDDEAVVGPLVAAV